MGNILEGKKGLIFGVANKRSLAWGIAEAAHKEGAILGFTYLNEMLEKRVRPLAEGIGSEIILPCNVQNDSEIDNVFKAVNERWGELDFLVHSIAYAPAEDLKGAFINTSRKGFNIALETSAYSLIAIANRALPLMKNGGSIVTLTYIGSERVVPHYRVMGVAKAALESCVRELAVELGEKQIRVNAISAGPVKTLAASGIADFKELLKNFEIRAPLGRLVTIEDIGKTAVYLLSDLASVVTGVVLYADCGFHATTVSEKERSGYESS